MLFIDELNKLGDVLDVQVTTFLKKHFLDTVGRYLVFASHRTVYLDEDWGKCSKRGIVRAPLPYSTNIEQLSNMFNGNDELNPVEVAMYGGIPSLIFTAKAHPEFVFKDRVWESLETFRDALETLFRIFLESVIFEHGFSPQMLAKTMEQPLLKSCRQLEGFGSLVQNGQVQFPIVYIGTILDKFLERPMYATNSAFVLIALSMNLLIRSLRLLRSTWMLVLIGS